MHAMIRGKRWRILHRRLKHEDGWCDKPDVKDKAITIDPRCRSNDARYLEVVLHEALHAAVWDLDEEVVAEYARDVARLLHRLGFRCTEGEDGKV